jgi:hypothetical protein
MRVSVSDNSSASRPEAGEALKMLPDYPIVRGTKRRLPAFVGLLRRAHLEPAKVGQAMRPRTLRGTERRVAP